MQGRSVLGSKHDRSRENDYYTGPSGSRFFQSIDWVRFLLWPTQASCKDKYIGSEVPQTRGSFSPAVPRMELMVADG